MTWFLIRNCPRLKLLILSTLIADICLENSSSVTVGMGSRSLIRKLCRTTPAASRAWILFSFRHLDLYNRACHLRLRIPNVCSILTLAFFCALLYAFICCKYSGSVIFSTSWLLTMVNRVSVQGLAKRWSPCCRQGQAEMLSNSRYKIHQTWGPPFSRSLCS